MKGRIHTLIDTARLAIERHGGGLAGLMSLSRRAFNVVRALGWRGFLQRVRLARRQQVASVPPAGGHRFPPPVTLSQLRLKVGVMAHVFYADLIEEFAQTLASIPVPYTLMVSVMDEAARRQAEHRFGHLPNAQSLHVRIVANRGRDIAPLLVTFRDEILALDVIGHIHTKKSLYTGSEQDGWRRYLLQSLLGDGRRIAWQLGMFQAEPRLGMIYPESHANVPLWAHTWLSNFEACRDLGQRLGIAIEPQAYIDFPAGSMFWARVDALRPLYALKLQSSDFPEERGQIDGTLQHAIERMFVTLARHRHMLVGILPTDGSLALIDEGERNWLASFDTAIATRLTLSALEARLVSLDVFDTLVVRPFLTPAGARAYLSHLAERHYGIRDFARWRDRAETKARAQVGRDADLGAIYRTLAALPGGEALPVADLEALELSLEKRLLAPRTGVIDAARALGKCDVRLVALSDMYLDHTRLQQVLPESVRDLPQDWYVSCETGWRKDADSAWLHLPEREDIEPAHWLHVGDNEHADIQLPQMHGLLTPVHVLRPSALFDVIPALRPLRPPHGSTTRWQDQLWLGLIANHFAEQADRAPQTLAPVLELSPSTVGYAVLGPLLFDYLAWLARLARERGIPSILFLSREGYLLQQAFVLLQQACPSLSSLHGIYLLTSRRASGTPSLHSIDDLALLLDSTYTGPLGTLLSARLGQPATQAIMAKLGAPAMQRDVFLPEMRQELLALLAPAAVPLLEVAAREREAYLRHWREKVTNEPAMVADIGYSGTIQANLARTTGLPLGGGYLALNSRASKISPPSWAEAYYHDARKAVTSDSAILQHDLLLESLLTSPDPQFSHFDEVQGHSVPVYAEPEHSREQLATLKQVHQGALRFFRDICAVTAEESWELEFDRELVQMPLRCVGNGSWSGGQWLRTLSVIDTFTGRGKIGVG